MTFERDQIRAVRNSAGNVDVFGEDGERRASLLVRRAGDFCWEVTRGGEVIDRASSEQGAVNSAFFELWG